MKHFDCLDDLEAHSEQAADNLIKSEVSKNHVEISDKLELERRDGDKMKKEVSILQ